MKLMNYILIPIEIIMIQKHNQDTINITINTLLNGEL